MIDPVIVIPCFNKLNSLKRLVKSLLDAKYSKNVKLIFSVDYSRNKQVCDFVNEFEWPYGEKIVFKHERNIGLRENILFCGSLTRRYGSVIILEDDSYVSHYFYDYACKAMYFYENDRDIAGISLYGYEYSEILNEKFYPLINGCGTYFMQWASSRGQLWTLKHWECFQNWYECNKDSSLSCFNIHDSVISWPESSWKKYFIAYVVDSDKYFVYPYVSLVTNCGDAGIHRDGDFVVDTQVSIPLYNYAPKYNFAKYEKYTSIKYDSFFQPMRSMLNDVSILEGYDFDIDLSGSKNINNIIKSHVLTSKKCKSFIHSFGNVLLPFELNIILNIKGKEFYFAKKEDVIFEDISVIQKANRIKKNREILSSKKFLAVFILYLRHFVKQKVIKLLKLFS